MLLSFLSTASPDPNAIQLTHLMKAIEKNGLCPDCQGKLNYNVQKAQKGQPIDFYLRPTEHVPLP